ncbi:hypothetical protein D1AOALGA4SA_6897 [Olavius algarvensis Delta 1 endosymbiont]|nr:hypothetical protein D1AOALGA4SA_6897 [Olavius algarvensis Delta 1 endosymbiont]
MTDDRGFRLRIADCGMRNADLEVKRQRTANGGRMTEVFDCGLRNAECGFRNQKTENN